MELSQSGGHPTNARPSGSAVFGEYRVVVVLHMCLCSSAFPCPSTGGVLRIKVISQPGSRGTRRNVAFLMELAHTPASRLIGRSE